MVSNALSVQAAPAGAPGPACTPRSEFEQRVAGLLRRLEDLLAEAAGLVNGGASLLALCRARREMSHHAWCLISASSNTSTLVDASFDAWCEAAGVHLRRASEETALDDADLGLRLCGPVAEPRLLRGEWLIAGSVASPFECALPVAGLESASALSMLARQVLASAPYRSAYWRRSARLAVSMASAVSGAERWLRSSCATRRAHLSAAAGRNPPGELDRGTLEGLRAQTGQSHQHALRRVNEIFKRSAVPGGRLHTTINRELDRLGERELAFEQGRRAVRVSLRAEVQDELAAALREDCGLDLAAAHETLRDMQAALTRQLRESQHGHFAALVDGLEPPPDPGTLLDRHGESFQPGVRYRGTLPRRGFLQRLSEGRRSVFTVLMFCSLFGSFLGFNWRNYPLLGWIFLAGFALAVSFTYRAWREEDDERIGDELERLRDALRPELRRIASDACRELLGLHLEWLEQQRRQLTAMLDERFRQLQASTLRAANASRERAQAALRGIEQRERQLQTVSEQVRLVTQDAAALARALES
ncbi:MAG: hypothetical protein K2Y51_20090 [Gammaproteobacteria bacterium]|nr:hypothetical protein [Gammaproteobacteria bacterium]